MSFEVIPAIDIKQGEVVRLTKGVMESAKIYDTNPCEVAKHFEEIGAEWVHIVDLDGAIVGKPVNLEIVQEIRKQTHLKIEVGGGIRNEEGIKRYIDAGIDRIILGSVAMRDPLFTISMAEKYPIVVGIDAKNGFVSVSGWVEQGKMQAAELAAVFKDVQLEAVICTDIGQDGTLSGINRVFSEEIAKASGHRVFASGGLANEGEIEDIMRSGLLSGVIVGKAFYEGKVNLEQVFKKINRISDKIRE
ncbi:1-(5-phosphoribosyl)-5-[(5-phosphoribosylamino)methylideneamino]imidazole-4-carboxamide isomerase [Helicobacter monodelphidis]|uniref:1-(5-phosphoribosyl)-5-[(5- phosphoribosylamino)methylideneamino]imidazole-4- carboxamide isomerase n=1 Tax=Helicobacter sp. 15-1451 TaxID=2004995 RepID=UPI000DCEA73B|nr:1-(5-phosphoribosyl)-5-[(5-phosphoribosylamino)methylideneamino]imidazole-4-carboxamide isomerase [Helicobacter sp. 15-1451]RAX57248.1 1-(5-phosphoribosyl)-5-[(5-phosphoribosylamino)methylideneamino]imidazole-4-carboxamide isomerase [Helicobacter sp. 15-1451]